MRRAVQIYWTLGLVAWALTLVILVVAGVWALFVYDGSGFSHPEPSVICDVTVERHPTQLRCELRDGVAAVTCGAVGDRVDP